MKASFLLILLSLFSAAMSMGQQAPVDNQPVKDALILAWIVVNDKASVTKYRSNESGEINFPVTLKGRWMISSVHMIPHTTSSEADWQSFWGRIKKTPLTVMSAVQIFKISFLQRPIRNC